MKGFVLIISKFWEIQVFLSNLEITFKTVKNLDFLLQKGPVTDFPMSIDQKLHLLTYK